MVKLSENEAEAVKEILNIGIPQVYVRQSGVVPYVGGLYFLFVTNDVGNIMAISECRGYHRRNLLDVVDGEYILINPLSPYAEGVFQSKQDVSNKFENHPLIKGVYKRELMDGYIPESGNNSDCCGVTKLACTRCNSGPCKGVV